MIYQLYQAQSDAMAMLRNFAYLGSAAAWQRAAPPGAPADRALRAFGAICEQIAGTRLSHKRPAFAIDHVLVGNSQIAVAEDVVHDTPFCSLLRFRKETGAPQPKVLLVAPMSGHFATLLRGTLKVMLQDHEVYITDWKNARDVPRSHGRFGLDEFVDHVVECLEILGPRSHVVAVCQPTVAVLAAVASMSQNANPATPRSMTSWRVRSTRASIRPRSTHWRNRNRSSGSRAS